MSSSNVIAGAKKALGTAEKKFPSAMARESKPEGKRMVAPSKPEVPAKPEIPTVADELKAKQDNVDQYAAAPKMHEGGIVPGKKGEDVPIVAQAGEKVIPAGRNSEYRKVFHSRMAAKKQTRQGGGNTPVTGEKHDQKKA